MEQEIREVLKSRMIELMDELENEPVGSVRYSKLMDDFSIICKQWRESEAARKENEPKPEEAIIWRLIENGPLVQAAAGFAGVIVLASVESFARIIIPNVAKSFVRFK